MVSGEIDAPLPPDPVPEPIEAGEVGDNKPNAAFWLAPLVCADDFDDVSALRASMADDAAPRAKNMTELQQGHHKDAANRSFVHVSQQALCHGEKLNKSSLSRIRIVRPTRQ
jgi:hypothetical protein